MDAAPLPELPLGTRVCVSVCREFRWTGTVTSGPAAAPAGTAWVTPNYGDPMLIQRRRITPLQPAHEATSVDPIAAGLEALHTTWPGRER